MADNRNYVIRNTKRKPCNHCSHIHEFITRMPEAGGTCNTPVAFSRERAEMTARLLANGNESIEVAPDDTVVFLDKSARKLPQSATHATLAQAEPREILA